MPSDEARAAVAAPLDQLLTQAANGPLRQLLPGRAGLRALGAMARRPQRVTSRLTRLGGELGRIAVGTSERAPARRDRRFADPAWTTNPLLRRLVQAYLAAGEAAEGVVDDLPLGWEDAQRMRFVTHNVVEALSPSNNPFVSPLAWKALVDTGGGNLVRGPRNLVADLRSAPRVPSMVDTDGFTVGADLAATPGDVVLRTPVFELIQYRPQTKRVHAVPVVVVPPTINKFYVLDLAPERSLVEHLVRDGHQVSMVSWRNPDKRHADWGFGTYVEALDVALAAAARIAGAERAHLVATCSGGMLASIYAAHKAAIGELDDVASLTLLVTMIDQAQAGTTQALMDPRTAAGAVAKSRRKGYLDGRALAEVFAWLRPTDLIWSSWVNNYVEGKRPPKFDILFWNADTTRMAARLHRDFVDVAMDNALVRPGGLTVLDTEIDLRAITVDAYVVAGSADHICPWESCYRSSRLLGGDVRFVLSSSGHVAALVNPPGNRKARFATGAPDAEDAATWQAGAADAEGSWWPDLSAWLAERSDGRRPAPATAGDDDCPPIEPAPGSYVLDH